MTPEDQQESQLGVADKPAPAALRLSRLLMAAAHQPLRCGYAHRADPAYGVQLLRIEEEGAFAGLVGGSPSVRREPSSRPRRTDLGSQDARFVTELVSGAAAAS